MNKYIEQFFKDGFLHLNNVISDETINLINQSSKDFVNKNIDNIQGSKQPRIVNLHSFNKNILSIFQIKLIDQLLKDLFSDNFTIYTSLYFKYPTQQPIHIDAPVFHTYPKYRFFGFWLALQDADESNGCLEVIPGSHKIEHGSPKVYCKSTGLNYENAWAKYQNDLFDSAIHSGLNKVKLPVKKGDVIIWHGNLMHGGSKPEILNAERNSMVFHITPYQEQVYQNFEYFNEIDRSELKERLLFDVYQGISYCKAPARIGPNV